MPNDFPAILCTLGTTTDEPDVLAGMVRAGMGMARVNTAYASMERIASRIDQLRATADIPVLLDLKGPQLRVDCTTERVDPETGRRVERPCPYPIEGGDLIVVGFGSGPVRFNHDFRADLAPGDLVTFDNGTIRTRVADPIANNVVVPDDAVLLHVLDAGGGRLSPRIGANVPGRALDLPAVSARDRQAIAMGVSRGVEGWALSFARGPDDIAALHQELVDHGDHSGLLVPKIEESQGIAALEDIVAAARSCGRPVAVMIARGDLFVECDPIDLPAIQRDLLARCRAMGAPAIVATGLLRTMQRTPHPSRAEVCDVAAAIEQGARSFLLSDETSNSDHPVEATATLARLIATYGA